MREYHSTNGRVAVMRMHRTSRGPYIGSHVEAHVGHDWNYFGSYSEAFEWLMSEYPEGWMRMH